MNQVNILCQVQVAGKYLSGFMESWKVKVDFVSSAFQQYLLGSELRNIHPKYAL